MHDEAQKKIILELRKMVLKGNNLQASTLVDNLSERSKLNGAHIRICLKILRDKGWLKAASWTATGQPVGLVEINIPPPPKPEWEVRWESVLANYENLTDLDREALRECGLKLADMEPDYLTRVIDGLIKLREHQAQWNERPSFLVSARYLLASSKLLTSLPGRAVKAFGINTDDFSAHPLYVVAGGCANPDLVVLIENPAAFELAMSTNAVKRCAFIATFGFGLSKQGEDYGNQLAGMVKSGFNEAITLIREGSDCPPAKVLLAHRNIVFWGDLDIAGMQIFERIAAYVPQIQLSALYRPMIEAIQGTERRHPYVMAAGSGKPGQKLFKSNRQDVQKMLTCCDRYAVDQEIVTPEEIELLAGQTLDITALGNVILPS